jgi:hypothetical protein
VRSGRAALALALVLAAPAARAEVETQLVLHLRYTDLRNVPSEQVLFDPALRTFTVRDYLVPARADSYPAGFAALGLEGDALEGDLHWVIRADTGVLRQQRFPGMVTACSSALSPTGLALPGTGLCGPVRSTERLRDYQLESTLPGQPILTSNGRAAGEELRQTLFVRQAYAAWSFGRAGFATLRAGRKRISVADGFVYDDYATGVEAALDLGAIGPPFQLGASLFQPTRDLPSSVEGISPVLALRADWLPSLFEHAGIFAAFHRDRSGSVAELFRSAIVEQLVGRLDQEDEGTLAYKEAANLLARVLDRPMTSSATTLWLGTSGSLAPWSGGRLEWTGAVLTGRVDRVGAGPNGEATVAQEVTLRGRLVSLTLEQGLGERVTLSGSFLSMSGGTFPSSHREGLVTVPGTGSYGGFLGISPYVPATNLFFQGGLSDAYDARQATAPGVNGRGVLGPIAGIASRPAAGVEVEARAAWLLSATRGPLGGRVYGPEADLEIAWTPLKWLTVGAEADVLWPGDFFAGHDPVYKAILAVDLVLE